MLNRICLALLIGVVGCGNVSSGGEAGEGGAGSAGAIGTAGTAGAELAGRGGAAGDGHDASGGAPGTGGTTSTGGAAAGGTVGTGGQGWARCDHPIYGAMNQESSSCFDTCLTSEKDSIGLTIGDNFGFCVGTTTMPIGSSCGNSTLPGCLPSGSTIYCRQTKSRVDGETDPKQTPNAPACP
jgi:hypothetical protein